MIAVPTGVVRGGEGGGGFSNSFNIIPYGVVSSGEGLNEIGPFTVTKFFNFRFNSVVKLVEFTKNIGV